MSDSTAPPPAVPSVVGYVLTKDCITTIEAAVTSLLRATAFVLVVDSMSTDGTREVAAASGAMVVQREFDSFSGQRNWALQELVRKWDPDFVFSLDGDEWLDEQLIADLQARISTHALSEDLYLVDRVVHFDGRVLRRGGFGRTPLLRMFRPRLCSYEDRLVNEHLCVPPGASKGSLRGNIEHADVESWTRHIEKHNRYSTLEAMERHRLTQEKGSGVRTLAAIKRPDLRNRWLRERVWSRVPMRPVLRFVQVFLLMGGFLDGRPGLRRAVFEAWQEMCIDLKAEALNQGRML
jgi:glycosyltransferase involved in cell wall biosynthesis